MAADSNHVEDSFATVWVRCQISSSSDNCRVLCQISRCSAGKIDADPNGKMEPIAIASAALVARTSWLMTWRPHYAHIACSPRGGSDQTPLSGSTFPCPAHAVLRRPRRLTTAYGKDDASRAQTQKREDGVHDVCVATRADKAP